MPDQIPVRPSTPTLDTFWTHYTDSGPRFIETANGVQDLALNAFQTDATFASAKADVSEADVAAATKYEADVQAYADLHGGFWPANGQPAAGDHTDVSSLEQGAPGSSSAQPASTEPTAPAITAESQLTTAPPAPSTEATTHVIVPNDHVSFLHRLVDDVEHDVDGAEQALVRAFRRVFERTAA